MTLSGQIGKSAPISLHVLGKRMRVHGDLGVAVRPKGLCTFHVNDPVAKSRAFRGAGNNADVLRHSAILDEPAVPKTPTRVNSVSSVPTKCPCPREAASRGDSVTRSSPALAIRARQGRRRRH